MIEKIGRNAAYFRDVRREPTRRNHKDQLLYPWLGRGPPLQTHRKNFSFLQQTLTRYGAVILGFAWVTGFLLFGHHVGHMLPTSTGDKTDAIVVFTGGSGRLREGFRLYHKGLGSHLLISGVHEDVRKEDLLPPESDLSKAVFLGRLAHDTEGNAEETAEWAEKYQIKSLRIVTSSYHMPRALIELRPLSRYVKITPHPVMPERWKRDPWWQSKKGLIIVFEEYHKFLVATLRQMLL
ncbi:YdcF family protein [Alphaproteobacteria bacterium]|nr:YdcF family protein [Alphaproteobacteria bacterium]